MELDKIEKLAELKEKGMISEEEYAQAKAKILNSPSTKLPAGAVTGMDNRTYSMLMHFSQLLNFVIPLFGLLVPIALWVTKRDDAYIDEQGKVVMNWIISSTIYFIVCLVLVFIVIGAFLLVGLAILNVVFIVMGAVRAKDGVIRAYPMSIPFFTVASNIEDKTR